MLSLLKPASFATRILAVTVVVFSLVHVLQILTVELARLIEPVSQRRVLPSDPARRSFLFLRDGTLHKIKRIKDANDTTRAATEEVYDANDTLLLRRPSPKEHDAVYLSFAERLNTSNLIHPYSISPGFSQTVDVPVFNKGTLVEIWRYDRKGEVFAGYDQSGVSLGYLGARGHQLTRANVTELGDSKGFVSWWPRERGSAILLWHSRNALYEIDVKARRVDRLIDATNSDLLNLWGHAWYPMDREHRGYVDPNLYRPLIVCRSMDQRYHLVLRDPNQTISFAPPEEWTQWANNYCQFSATKTDLFLKRSWWEFPARPQEPSDAKARNEWFQEFRRTKKFQGTELYHMDGQGNLELVRQTGWRQNLADADYRIADGSERGVYRVVRCISPGLYAWIVTLMGPQSFTPWLASLQDLVTRIPHSLSPIGLLDYLPISLLMAGVAFWHGRRRLTSRASLISWLAFVFTFNLAGLLTYLALNHTALMPCKTCGKKRSIEQDACPRCAAPLPVPAPSAAHLIMS